MTLAFITAACLVGIREGWIKSPISLSKVTTKYLMQFSMAGMSSANKAVATSVEDINQESADFTEEMAAKWEYLQGIMDELTPEYLLPFPLLDDPFTQYKTDPLTDPDLYYSRIHIGNPGVLALDIIPNYVDLSLTLPGIDPFTV